MGQAKRRGTFEQRLEQAQSEVTPDNIKAAERLLKQDIPRKYIRRVVPLAVLLSTNGWNKDTSQH